MCKERRFQKRWLPSWCSPNTALTACCSEIACCHPEPLCIPETFSLYPRNQLAWGWHRAGPGGVLGVGAGRGMEEGLAALLTSTEEEERPKKRPCNLSPKKSLVAVGHHMVD